VNPPSEHVVAVDAGPPPVGLDTTTMHTARRYNYWLGGTTNFPVDRESGDRLAGVYPAIRTAVRENRAFMLRAAHHLAARAGIRQFLDIGSGIPTDENLHDVVRAVAPECRVVYVDIDPLVLMHGRALLATLPEADRTAYVEGDLREPERILADPDLRRVLDLTEPVGLMLGAVLHFVPDAGQAYGIVDRLVTALASGSHLTLSHHTTDLIPPATAARLQAEYASGRLENYTVSRDHAEVTRFFTGLDLVGPGVVPVPAWLPTVPPESRPAPEEASIYGAVARKP
jgi:hypothetical protein